MVGCQTSPSSTDAKGQWTAVQPQLRIESHTIACSGQVEVPPQFRATVSAPLGGFVRQIHHYVGDAVQKGEVLCVLENPEFIKLQQAFMESRSLLVFLEADAPRKEKLAEEDATSQRTLEMAQSAFQEERARYQSLKATLALVGISEATMERQGIVNQVSVRSPIDGFITDIPVNVGQFVKPEDVIYTVIDPSHLHLEIRVFPNDLAWIQPGMKFSYTLPGGNGPYEGHIKLVGKEVDPIHRAVTVHGHPEEAQEGMLTPGTFVDVLIPVSADSIWVVPTDVLQRKGTAPYVLSGKDGPTDTLWMPEPQLHEGWLVVPPGAGPLWFSVEEEEEGHGH